MREMLTGGELDYLTGDYLAELTMLILGRDRDEVPRARLRQDLPDPARGVPGHWRSTAACASSPTPAGSTRPGWPQAVRALAERLGLPVDGRPRRGRRPARPGRASWASADAADRQRLPRRLGHRRLPELRRRRRRHRPGHRRLGDRRARPPPTSAGARDDYDRLAGAVVAGHVIECGTQATGGNYSFFTEIPDLTLRRLPDRRDPRRRLVGDHQASRHRRAGQRRHRHRATALRDRRRRATPIPT